MSSYRVAFVVATVALLPSNGALAAVCKPQGVLQNDVPLKVIYDQSTLGSRLEMIVTQPITLSLPLAALQNEPANGPAAGALRTTFATVVNVELRLEHVTGGIAIAAASGAQRVPTSLTVKKGSDYFSIGANDAAFPLRPPIWEPISAVLAAGSPIAVDVQGRVVLQRGAKLNWEINDELPALYLTHTGYFDRALPPVSDSRLEVDAPGRSPPGGVLGVLVRRTAAASAVGETTPWMFCLQTATSEHLIGYDGVRLVSRSPEGVRLEVTMPEDLPTSFRRQHAKLLLIAVGNSSDGASASVTIVNPYVGVAIGIVVLALVTLIWRMNVANWRQVLEQAIAGRSGRASLSNVQVLVWSAIVAFTYLFVWFTKGFVLDLSEEILGLLGISTATAALAKGVAVAKDAGKPSPAERVLPEVTAEDIAAPTAEAARLADLVQSDGEIDVLRFQMLAFNLFAWVYTLAAVWSSQALPDIPDSLYLLLGISNTGYLGGKLVTPRTGAPVGAPSAFEHGLSADQIKLLQQQLQVGQTGTLDAETRRAISAYQSRNGIVPDDGTLNAFLVEKIIREP